MLVKTALVFLGVAAFTASAAAQTGTAGTAQCKPDVPTPVEVGDNPGHAFAIGKANCTWSGFAVAGVPSTSGISVSLDEITGDKATSNGYHTATYSNGDKTVAHFQGAATMKDGKFLVEA